MHLPFIKFKNILTLPIAFFALVLGTIIGIMNFSYPYLAKNTPPLEQTFILEGWLPDYAIEQVIALKPTPSTLITTGGPLPIGSHLSEYKTYATLARHTLIKLGYEQQQIIPLTYTGSQKNRTLQNAKAFNDWLIQNPEVTSACLVSLGPHTRRSYNTYKSVLPDEFELGCIAIEPRDYDPEEWWKTSAGFKNVTYESIAYVYSLFAL